ncbi:MAG TPA: dihydrodipicolinate reductase C-terminal domain-containing protein [Acidobacteriota bacterium]|nr:dihydrodipicolinate reductase C-terminal domain-containing protein [Acidobacteriota bacterium]HNH85006.1 dihydrodipicolinate reductase C-terminal domain-containing protein [Acidobacteriota bacterium]
MNIVLFGDGKMGHEIRKLAAERGFHVVGSVTRHEISGEPGNAKVAIDFSHADAIGSHLNLAIELGLNLVIGTTGWNAQLPEVRRLVNSHGLGLMYSPNFSLGVQLSFRIAQFAAQLVSAFETHQPYIVEAHHQFKKDAPSGTALRFQQLVSEPFKREIPTTSLRAGFIPGTHRVGFDSEFDTIELVHTARQRTGFADGALLAARWIAGKQGVFEFSTLIDEQLNQTFGVPAKG